MKKNDGSRGEEYEWHGDEIRAKKAIEADEG